VLATGLRVTLFPEVARWMTRPAPDPLKAPAFPKGSQHAVLLTRSLISRHSACLSAFVARRRRARC